MRLGIHSEAGQMHSTNIHLCVHHSREQRGETKRSFGGGVPRFL
ncbi:hypothetical protein [Nostoc sp. LEGE 06077]|nr:hypothetical protein [Nostoc sp. LEGE 06077]